MTHGCTDPTTSQQLNRMHINKILRPCDLAAQQKTLRLCSHRVQGAWRDIPRAWVFLFNRRRVRLELYVSTRVHRHERPTRFQLGP